MSEFFTFFIDPLKLLLWHLIVTTAKNARVLAKGGSGPAPFAPSS